MPKRYGRKIKGGDLSSWWNNNVTNNSLMSRSKNYFSGLLGSSSTSSPQGYYPTTQQPYQQTTNTQQPYQQTTTSYLPNYGGKKGTRSRRGGFQPNTPANNIASAAAPVSGLATARAHTWVGGKTKRRSHKHSKSCKHSKSLKYHKHSKSCKH